MGQPDEADPESRTEPNDATSLGSSSRDGSGAELLSSESSSAQAPSESAPASAADDEAIPEQTGVRAPRDEAAPPTPQAGPSPDDDPDELASMARSILLAVLLGLALVVWGQLTFHADWAEKFLRHNDLDMPRRMRLVFSMIAGAGVAIALTAVALGWHYRNKLALSRVESWMWFLSPLIVLPALPVLLRYKVWIKRNDELLLSTLASAALLELLAFQSARAAPERARRWFASLFREVPQAVRGHGPLVVVAAGALFYAVFMTFYTVQWHHQLGTGIYDLAINNNLLYGGFYGDFNQSAVVFPDNPQKYIANHVKLGGYVFLPFYALYPQPEFLLGLQSTALGMGALPLYGFAKRYLPAWWAALVSLCWLAYYPIHCANFYEMKWVPVASFFVLSAVWAAEYRHWKLFTAAFVIALLMREDMPIGLAVIGAFLLLSGYRPFPGLVMTCVSCLWFVLLRFYVMEEVGKWWFPKMYKDLWSPGEDGFRSVIKTLLTNPSFVLDKISRERQLIYILHLLTPLVFLPARRWYLWAAFIPGFFLTLIVTDYKPPTMYTFQYVMHWAPYLFLAAVLALWVIRREAGAPRAGAALAATCLAVAVTSYNWGAFPARTGTFQSGYRRVGFDFSRAERRRYENLRTLIAMIPGDASVAASEKVGPHVSSRRRFYSLRRGNYDADYILVRKAELNLDHTEQSVKKALKSKEYGVARQLGDIVLLKRGADPKDNQRLLEEWDF